MSWQSDHTVATKTSSVDCDDRYAKLQDILRRARHYGIDSLDELDFQSDVGHLRTRGSKSTDLIASRQDLELWSILFDYRVHQYGVHGASDIVYGMRWRGTSVKLYRDDKVSARFWEALLPVVTEDEDLLASVCNPATGLARELLTLCGDVLSELLLQGKTELAALKARQLGPRMQGTEDIKAMFEITQSDDNDVSVQDFWKVYRRLPRLPDMYSYLMASLWTKGSNEDANFIHSRLLRKGDYPSSFTDIEPLVGYLAHAGQPILPLLRELESYGISYSWQAKRMYWEKQVVKSGMPTDALDLIEGSTVRRSGRQFSDKFVARLFATSSTSFEAVMRGLNFFGLRELGPLALREIALSSGTIETMTQRLAAIRASKMDLGASAMAAIVTNLCAAGHERLLQDIVRSDQHHDVFEDIETQKRLLAESYSQKNWQGINVALTAINRGRTDSLAKLYSFRLLLQTAIVLRDWRGALIMLADRRRHGLQPESDHEITDMSLNLLYNVLLPAAGKIDYKGTEYVNRTRFAVSLLQDLDLSGITIGTADWRRLIWHAGNRQHWMFLEQLCLWLCHISKTKTLGANFRNRLSTATRNLFDADFQAAVIHWSFCSGINADFSPHKMEHDPMRGMRLLHRLTATSEMQLARADARAVFVKKLQQGLPDNASIAPYMEAFDALWTAYARGDSSRVSKDRGASRKTWYNSRLPRNNAEFVRLFQQPTEVEILDDESVLPLQSSHPEGDDFVEYQDLFHPSSKDYGHRR